MRRLALTSPEMRGQDVRKLQHVLDERLAHYKSRTRVKADGIYGRATAHALATVAYAEGLQHYDGETGVLELVEHPHLRQPAHLKRAHDRAKARAEGDRLAGGGVQGLARIVNIARHYVGVAERPPGSNWGEPHPAQWEREFGFGSGVSWCGCFAGAMVRLAGGHVTSRVAFCPYIEADARSKSNGFDRWVPNHGEGVGPGWLVLFNWSGGSEPEHVGIVRAIHDGYLDTIEGNTGGSNPSDGGMVALESRPYSLTVGYARPRLP